MLPMFFGTWAMLPMFFFTPFCGLLHSLSLNLMYGFCFRPEPDQDTAMLANVHKTASVLCYALSYHAPLIPYPPNSTYMLRPWLPCPPDGHCALVGPLVTVPRSCHAPQTASVLC